MSISRVWIMMFGLVASLLASAQAYPNRPVTLVVPFSANGPTDLIGRTIGAAMSKVVFVDAEGRPWVRGDDGDLKRISHDEAQKLFAAGYTRERKPYDPKVGF